MKQYQSKKELPLDRVEGDRIVLNGQGIFPKKIIIFESQKKIREYELKKTASGKYLLN